jgi:hypothetical protein
MDPSLSNPNNLNSSSPSPNFEPGGPGPLPLARLDHNRPNNFFVRFFGNKTGLIIIGAIVAVILGIIMLVVSNINSPASTMQRLNARLVSLKTVLDQGTDNIADPKLSEINANAVILFVGDNIAIRSELNNIGVSAPSQDIINSESDKVGLDNLESDKASGNFDSGYKKLLSDQLDSTRQLLKTAYKRSNSKELSEAINKAYVDFGQVLEQLNKL